MPEALCEVFSPRSREVAEARAEIERELGIRLQGGALAVLAKETRQAKDHDLDPEQACAQVWDALGQEHDFGPGAGSRLRRRTAATPTTLEARMAEARDVVLAQLREQGPTVSLARARALVFEAAAGRLSAEEAARLLARMECSKGGELLALAGGRVTSREIRQLEQHVMDVAVGGGGEGSDAVAALGRGGARRRDFRRLRRRSARAGIWTVSSASAFELLTGGRWVGVPHRAGRDREGSVLHAAAEAYRAAGWRVIACAMDGTTARRMAEQLGGIAPALTVEQLKVRTQAGAIDARRSHGDLRRRGLQARHRPLGRARQRGRAATARSVRAVGHDGQHDAIRLPGLFSEMLADQRIPDGASCGRSAGTATPTTPRTFIRGCATTRSPSTRAAASTPSRSSKSTNALKLYDTRAQAMGGMVEEWDRWRRGYEPAESALIVHGPNSDVDLVNELAQQKRLDAGELGAARGPRGRPRLPTAGPATSSQSATPPTPSRPSPAARGPSASRTARPRSSNPSTRSATRSPCCCASPAPNRGWSRSTRRGCVEEHAAGKRAAAVRLNYALHSFPAQGATVHGTATLAGHWSQAKQRDLRRRHPRDLPPQRPRRPRGPRHRRHRRGPHRPLRPADLRQPPTPRQHPPNPRPHAAARRRPAQTPAAPRRDIPSELGPRDPSPETSPSTRDTSLSTAVPAAASDVSREASAVSDACRQQPAPVLEQLERALSDPPEHLIRALGPPPDERIARERWEREAQRLQALHPQAHTVERAAPPRPSLTDPVPSRHPPASPPAPTQRSGPTIRR